jgi:hypothetical protein
MSFICPSWTLRDKPIPAALQVGGAEARPHTKASAKAGREDAAKVVAAANEAQSISRRLVLMTV